MKGRFFQSLVPKWQRKLGALKAEETFKDLFNRACTVEKQDEQYSQSAADKTDNLAQTSQNLRIKLKVRRVGVGLRRVSPRCLKDWLCA